MSIASTNLPMPANYAVRQSNNVFEPRADLGELVISHKADDDLKPRIWLLTWQFAVAAKVDAIWQHYSEHAVGSFKWIPPGEASQRCFRWMTPPTFQWTSAIAASVTAEIEEVLAFQP